MVRSGDKKSDTEKNDAQASDPFSYDALAHQTLELWREQLSHMFNTPDGLKDLNLAPMFSNGMDMWLMILEQLSKTATMNTQAGTQDAHDSDKNNPNRSSAASALSGASTYAVAELAKRLSDLEKRFDEFAGSNQASGKSAARKPAAKKKKATTPLEAVKRARPKR